MYQIPCRDLIQAHCLRSWLLSHEIEADVIHEHSGALCAFQEIFPPQVVIADEDVERFQQAAREQEAPLDDSFVPPTDDEVPAEKTSPAPSLPSLLEMAITGAILGGALGLLVLIVSSINHAFEAARSTGVALYGYEKDAAHPELVPILGALGGALGGLLVWPLIVWARFRTRWVSSVIVPLLVGYPLAVGLKEILKKFGIDVEITLRL